MKSTLLWSERTSWQIRFISEAGTKLLNTISVVFKDIRHGQK